ncbi:MAG: ABC transporter ATP-binding protein [Spirochaetales bacterium]|nr:ABC transporter ATP-binding protein [Spirochaetales bacterium]
MQNATNDAAPLDDAVVIEALNAFYGKSRIIHDLSVRIAAGKISVLVGRNGMGKSTLVKSIMNTGGVTRSGSIRLFEEEIGTMAAHEVARRGVAYVPQGRRLFPSLSVEEHLLLSVNVRKADERAVWNLRSVYELFPEFEERRRVGGSRLSGGEQQMLAIARALLLNPRVLIMDEPSEGLSKMVIKRVEETCRRVSRSGIAVLLVEQNLEMALNLADHSFVLVNGQVTYDHDGDQFRKDRVRIAGFLGV